MTATDMPGRGAVVITGASTGIGRATALHLDSLGFQVFGGVRRTEDAEKLKADASERLVPLMIDITDGTAVRSAAAMVGERVGERGLAGLVNNAGIAVAAPLEFVPIDEFKKQIEVNLIGQVAVTQAFIPLLRTGRGRVVNVGSIGGKVALPLLGPYAASKFAMEGLTDSLRRELMPWGISVSILEPGGVATPIWDRGVAAGQAIIDGMPPEAATLYGDRIAAIQKAAVKISRDGMPPEEVARTIEHALTARKPKTRYLIGRDAKIRARLSSILPDRVFDRMISRALGG
jgi:NAD(P)-dependent dehydrogenase (short-subunit alcohol dehydrogenase family)